jgi:hypothetical protein
MTSGDFPDDFEFITTMQGAKIRAEDFQRLQDSIAGRETGHGNKHQRGENRKSEAVQKRALHTGTALDLLMQDPDYEAAYNRVSDLLGRAEVATEMALAEAETALEEIVDQTVKLPGGSAVFRDKDGNARTEDGEIVDAAIAVGVDWPDDAPTYEDYSSTKKRINDLREFQVDTLGKARNELEDETSPPSTDRMEEIEQEISDGTKALVLDSASEKTISDTVENSANIELPPLGR